MSDFDGKMYDSYHGIWSSHNALIFDKVACVFSCDLGDFQSICSFIKSFISPSCSKDDVLEANQFHFDEAHIAIFTEYSGILFDFQRLKFE